MRTQAKVNQFEVSVARTYRTPRVDSTNEQNRPESSSQSNLRFANPATTGSTSFVSRTRKAITSLISSLHASLYIYVSTLQCPDI